MKMYIAVIKNQYNTTIAAPQFVAESLESFESSIKGYWMKQAIINTWIRTDDKKPFRFICGEAIR